MNGGTIDWKSSKQRIVVQFTTESEYIVKSEAAKGAVWIKKFNAKLGVLLSITRPMKMYCDKFGALILAKGSRYILRQFHYVSQACWKNEINILKVHIDLNIVDPLCLCLPPSMMIILKALDLDLVIVYSDLYFSI